MATTFKVNVKWTKQLFKDVELNTSEPPSVFQTQLWTLTGVPPERQTVLLKGGKLKESTVWEKAGIRENMTIMMMGTVDANQVPPPPSKSLVRNDLDADGDDMDYEPVTNMPPGLVNKGNTCYMNATVQCLNVVQPLADTLTQYRGRTDALGNDEKLSASLRDLVSRLRSGNAPKIDPSTFLNTLRQVNPQFAEVGGPHRMFMQQDAEECFGEILSRLSNTLTLEDGEGTGETGNKIDQLFSLQTKSVDTCEEDETEPPIEREESIRMLKCHISRDVNHLNQGIKEGLEDSIEKHSEKLGRSAKWKRTSKLNKIPPFVIVQFVRFFWKPVEQVKAKILRNVSFPVQLDLFDLCTKELQDKLSEKRTAAAELPPSTATTENSATPAGNTETPAAAAPAVPAATEGSSASVATDATKSEGLTESEIGNYELCAVLTHKGRAADSGHYVAWVKDEGTRWHKYDDDTVTEQTEEDVKKLSGGGDWHMAYMCVYRAKNTF